MQFYGDTESYLWQELPPDFNDLGMINKRRKKLIERDILPNVPITKDNKLLLLVVLDTHVDDSDIYVVPSIEIYKIINYMHRIIEKGKPCNNGADSPALITNDLSCISNSMLNSVSDVVVAWPIQNQTRHYKYISLLKELNNEPDAYFEREIRYGHDMQKLIRSHLANLWPKLREYKA